jgi:tRNA pseudouridine13 synthase
MAANQYLTGEIPGIGGRIKTREEDFVVDEVPLYPPSGKGEHLLVRLRKRGRTTHDVVATLARFLEVPAREIGFAGIKDARAITTQWLSVPYRTHGRLETGHWSDVEILDTARHDHKLRSGHLRGNRFRIVVRGARGDGLADAERTFSILSRRGVPNRFGEQRFGTKDDNDRIGRCLVLEDHAEALRWYLGAPSPLEGNPRIHQARQLFEEGSLEECLATYPQKLRNERKALQVYLRTSDPVRALATIPKSLRLLFLSAYQSRLFNRCLDQRLDAIDRLIDGDVAVKQRNLAAFVVEDLAAEQARAERFEISPAGPLFGPGLLACRRAAAALEHEVFAAEGIDPTARGAPFRDVHLKGERRPYRFPLTDPEISAIDGGFEVSFELPKGCYATTVLAELMKPE